jgi:hypothetical protein
MPIYKNVVIKNAGGNGVNHVFTQYSDPLVMENCLVDGSLGHGVNTEPGDVDVVKLFGLPQNTDREALAQLLVQLASEPSEEKRKGLLDPEGGLMKSLKVGTAAASLTNTLLTISTNPAVHSFIDGLLRLAKAK